MPDEVVEPVVPVVPHGTVKLFHASGVYVLLPVPCDPDMVPDYKGAYLAVNAALEAGWLPTAPGMEQGEEKELVGYVVRGQIDGRDGMTDFLLLYSVDDNKKFSFLKVYLNRTEDVQAFEAASGMKLAAIPVYVGQDKPERGKNRQVEQFFKAPPRPFGVVLKGNPKWTQEGADAAKAKNEMYTVPKRVFLRWDGQQPTAGGQQQTQPANGATIENVLAKCKEFIASDPPVDVFNRFFHDTLMSTPTQFHPRIWSGIRAHAKACNWQHVSDDPIQYTHAVNQDADGGIPF